MNVWSLFSGVGGLDLGIERAGGTVVLQCEWESYRRDVLAARFPGVPCFPDVAALRVEPAPRAAGDGRVTVSDGTGRVHTVAVPDLLIGGFPCQDVSVAGQRRGLAGSRSGLFFDACRIVEAVRPRAVLLENVPGLLSSNGGRDFGVVLGTLADLGYGLAWRVVDSRFFGVPQRRRRVFICGVDADGRAGADLAGEVLAVGSRCSRHPATGDEEGQVDPLDAVAGTLGGRRGFTGDDIDRGGLGSLSGMGNGGPDDNDAQANRIVAETVRSHPRPGSNSDGQIVVASTLKAQKGRGWSHDAEATYVAAPLTSGGHPNSNAPGRRKEDDVNLAVDTYNQTTDEKVFHTLRDPHGTFGDALPAVVAFHPTGGGAKGLSESEDVAPGTGTGTGGTVSVTFTARGRDGGTQIETQDDGIHPALRSGRGGGRRDSGFSDGQIVRRLMPVECERLQGFPDGWTDLGDTPDTPRYSALGDAVTVPVAEWIGGRL